LKKKVAPFFFRLVAAHSCRFAATRGLRRVFFTAQVAEKNDLNLFRAPARNSTRFIFSLARRLNAGGFFMEKNSQKFCRLSMADYPISGMNWG
jgi:hypothetical protein